MRAYVIRHAKAGKRGDWDGDDRQRPLSKAGWRQAAAIDARLLDEKVTGLWSSPYRRCVETLGPLARRTGLIVTPDDRLSEAADLAGALELLREGGDGAVLCSHGDVVPDIIEGLVRRGATVTGTPDWRKASIWFVDVDGDVTTLRPEPPPA